MIIKKIHLFTLIFVISGCSSNEIIHRNVEFTQVTTVLEETSGIAYLPKEIDPFTGIYKKYYANGKKELESTYKKGKKDGLTTGWLENGHIKYITRYKGGDEIKANTEAETVSQKSIITTNSDIANLPSKRDKEIDPLPKSHNPHMEILGLAIGEPFTLPECDYHRSGLDNDFPTCWEQRMSLPNGGDAFEVFLKFKKVPRGISQSYIVATILNGNLERMVIHTMGLNAQNIVFDQLSSKYGKPWSKRVNTVHNYIGGSFEKIFASWHFDNIVIYFSGLSQNTGIGEIEVVTPLATEYLHQVHLKEEALQPNL